MKAKTTAFFIRETGSASAEGFSLVESVIALFLMCAGLLAVAQLLFAAASGPALARSKSSATLAAQQRLEVLAEQYRQNPDGVDLSLGAHGPDLIDVLNQNDGSTLNRYRVTWTVSNVQDPRPGKLLKARLVSVLVVPITTGGAVNNRTSLNKVISMTSIFSARPQY